MTLLRHLSGNGTVTLLYSKLAMSYFYEKGTLILPSIDNIICHIYKKGVFISEKGHFYFRKRAHFPILKKVGGHLPPVPPVPRPMITVPGNGSKMRILLLASLLALLLLLLLSTNIITSPQR